MVRKTCVEGRKITLLTDVQIRKQFEEKVIKLVDVGAPNLWGLFKHGVLKVCDEVCVGRRGGGSKGETW